MLRIVYPTGAQLFYVDGEWVPLFAGGVDNTVLSTNVGTGDTIATDDDGTAKHQWVKVEFGGDGTFTPVTTSVGLPTDVLDRAARDCGKVDIAMGQAAHDAAGAAFDPVATGGYASAAAPTDVSADTDIVRAWYLRNGAQATVVTAAGALIGGDATNGLDVDVTRVTGTVTVDSELPTAAALADNTANPTVPAVGAFLMAYDGTNWDRVQTGGAATGALKVDGSAVTQPVSIAATVTVQDANLDNTTLVDNAGFTDGTTRVSMQGYIFDETAGTALTENDAAAGRIDSKRAQIGVIEDETTRGRRCTVTASNALKVDGSAVTQPVSGTVTVGGVAAHDAAVSGNPVLLAGEARQTNPTAVADGDVARLMTDDVGRLVVVSSHVRDRVVNSGRISLTSTTETSLLSAGGAGVFRDLTLLTLSNESATKVRVDIRDATAGTVIMSMTLAADGGGAIIPFNPPWKQTTSNNAWTVQLSGAVSTVYISANAVENV